MTAAILALMIASPSPLILPGLMRHDSSLQLHLDDDIPASFGNTRAAPDVWFDNNGTTFSFTSTSVDGGGTDGDIFTYTLGTNMLTFPVGTLYLTGASLLLANDKSVIYGTNYNYWGKYLSASTAFTFNSTNINGSGTDGVIWWVDDAAPYFYVGTLTQAIRLDAATTDGVLRLSDESAGANLKLELGTDTYGFMQYTSGHTYFGAFDAYRFSINTGDTSTSSNRFGIIAEGGSEVKGGDGVSSNGIYYTDTINQSGTAAFSAFNISITDTASGSGQDYLANWSWGSNQKFAVQDDGTVFLGTSASQGILLDGTTTDGELAITDENAANATLKVADIKLDDSASGSGAVSIYAVARDALSIRTSGTSTANITGEFSLSTGPNTNVGDYDTGDLLLYTGATTTDGDTGDVKIYSGAAGAGAADAGDIYFSVNGAPGGGGTTALTIDGGTGAVLPNRVVGTDALAEPFSCTASVAGAVVYVDDTDDSAAAVHCICFATGDDGGGNPTMDWRAVADPTGTACSAF